MMRKYTFSGPGNARSDGRGPTTVIAANEAEARHLAMVERWGHPNGQPAQDVDSRTGRCMNRRSVLTGIASSLVAGVAIRPMTLSPAQVEMTIRSVLTGGDLLPWETHVEQYPELYPLWREACITRRMTNHGMTREQALRFA